jgi:hypothetical protein
VVAVSAATETFLIGLHLASNLDRLPVVPCVKMGHRITWGSGSPGSELPRHRKAGVPKRMLGGI